MNLALEDKENINKEGRVFFAGSVQDSEEPSLVGTVQIKRQKQLQALLRGSLNTRWET